MAESQKEMSDEAQAQALAQCAALAKKRGRDIESEINVLPLHTEAICLGLRDAELRALLEELGRLENLESMSPSGLKPFVSSLREGQAQKIRDYLSEHDYRDGQKILDYISESERRMKSKE